MFAKQEGFSTSSCRSSRSPQRELLSCNHDGALFSVKKKLLFNLKTCKFNQHPHTTIETKIILSRKPTSFVFIFCHFSFPNEKCHNFAVNSLLLPFSVALFILLYRDESFFQL